MPEVHNRPALEPRRKELRSSLTPAEAALWKSLQRSQVCGKKFRRQHSVGNYILDFYCPECRLAVELDGQGHFNPMTWEHDLRRTEYLQKLNIRVVRFENRDVFEHLEWVLCTIGDNLTNPAEGNDHHGASGKHRGGGRYPPPALALWPLPNQEGWRTERRGGAKPAMKG